MAPSETLSTEIDRISCMPKFTDKSYELIRHKYHNSIFSADSYPC
jgi:hypothetical protein